MRYADGTYDLTIDDIHEIRERNYELTKNMTTKERIEYIKGTSKNIGFWKL